MHIPKTQQQRLEELRQALVVIEQGLRATAETQELAHLLPVVGQLRSLLVSSGQTPLLLDLAKQRNFPLEFYSIPLGFLDNEEIARILGPTRIQWSGDSIRATSEGPPFHNKVTMAQWLSSTQLVVRGVKVSGEQLLKLFANKLGGAHYAPSLPPELAAIAQFEIGGVPSQYITFIRLSEVVVYLGRRLLAQAS
ncbi:MAG: hypothetical protein HY670_06580 [Chloroflexi bacterium]|nr:hypothetical protein [Chloroflexota bacterium]